MRKLLPTILTVILILAFLGIGYKTTVPKGDYNQLLKENLELKEQIVSLDGYIDSLHIKLNNSGGE